LIFESQEHLFVLIEKQLPKLVTSKKNTMGTTISNEINNKQALNKNNIKNSSKRTNK
jgi:hypothetical protein